jgi:hypothetical protein
MYTTKNKFIPSYVLVFSIRDRSQWNETFWIECKQKLRKNMIDLNCSKSRAVTSVNGTIRFHLLIRKVYKFLEQVSRAIIISLSGVLLQTSDPTNLTDGRM